MATFTEDIVGGRGYGFGGDGFGGGLGLIAILALLARNNGGLFGGNGEGVSGLNNLQGAIDTNAILGKLGTIEGLIPLTEAQVQLALAGVQNSLQQSISAVQLETANGFGTTNANIERTGWQISQTVKDDGDKTRALITANQIADLNRQLGVAQLEAVELRSDSRAERDRHGIEITMNNNQNQNQLQFQAQAQVLQGLTNALFEVGQIARATNSNVIVGNAGATTTGAMTANPTNVRA